LLSRSWFMTKAEQEHHHQQYHALLVTARQAALGNRLDEAVELAVHSLDHVDGMMQYERKYNGIEFLQIEAIDVVIRFAPFVLDSAALDKLESLVKSQRRIAKNTGDDLLGKLSNARELMWDVHRFWNHL